MASPTVETNLIGVCDGELDPKRHRSSFLTNKVGGQPDWLPVISRHSPRCGRCGAALAHVAQVYCPLDASPYHRNLHLFACLGAQCSCSSDGWAVLRSQGLETEVAAAQTASRPAPPQEAPLSATDWCDTADDWGMEEEEEEEDGGWGGGVKKDTRVQVEVEGRPAPAELEVSSRLQDLTLGQSQEEGPVFRPFFISVVEESDLWGEEEGDMEHVRELLRDYESREGAVVTGAGVGEVDGGEEKYEKTRARHGDQVFSRFMKKVSLCPQQVLRYCHRGSPRFISEPPANMAQVVPVCGSCGGARAFELQLMPALVSQLRGSREEDGGGGAGAGAGAELEFGTVLVYTCVDSCWTAGSGSAVEEFCFVQADPDQQLFQ